MVKRATGGSQQPWVSSSPIDGDFYFTGKAAVEMPKPAPPAALAATTPATTTPAPSRVTQSSLEQRAIAFVTEDMNKSQGTARDYLDHARRSLDERIDYYGKLDFSREVLKDKERYVAHWPVALTGCVLKTRARHAMRISRPVRSAGLVDYSLSNPATGRQIVRGCVV